MGAETSIAPGDFLQIQSAEEAEFHGLGHAGIALLQPIQSAVEINDVPRCTGQLDLAGPRVRVAFAGMLAARVVHQ